MKIKILVIAILLFSATRAFPHQQMTKQQIVHCVCNEAGNQGNIGIKAVIHSIINRNSLKGVYGCKRNRFQPESTYRLVSKLYEEAIKEKDFTNGATHWENIKDFGKPYWSYKMIETFRYKDHVFYKENKK